MAYTTQVNVNDVLRENVNDVWVVQRWGCQRSEMPSEYSDGLLGFKSYLYFFEMLLIALFDVNLDYKPIHYQNMFLIYFA